MNKKIFGILICMLFIGTSVLPKTNADVVIGLDPDSSPLIPEGAPPNCGYEDFETGTEGEKIISTIPGLKFITTGGFDWIYGDWRTNQYNGKYPNGYYTSQGNIFAWLGPQQNSGIIDFTEGDASYFSCYVSTYSGAVVDAFKDNGDFLCSSGWASNNLGTGKMTLLSVCSPNHDHDIGYVIVHDSGNYWCIDRVVCDAPGVGIPQHPIVKVEIDSKYLGNQEYEVNVALINNGEDSISSSTNGNGIQIQVIGGTIKNYDKGDFDRFSDRSWLRKQVEPVTKASKGWFSACNVIEFYEDEINFNEQLKGNLIVKTIYADKAVIGISGWITDRDETDKVYNPFTKKLEFYIARCPLEEEKTAINNPYTLEIDNTIFPHFSFVDYALNYYPLYSKNNLNTKSHSIWIDDWIEKTDNQIKSILDNLRSHDIDELYLFVGGSKANGDYYLKNWETNNVKEKCKNFLNIVRNYNLNNNYDFVVFAWIFGDPIKGMKGDYIYDINIENVRNKIVEYCSTFVSDETDGVGFDGIHFDYEFYENAYSVNYFKLLDAIHNSIGTSKKLSVAIQDGWLGPGFISDIKNKINLVKGVASVSNEIVLMAYVCFPEYEEFTDWVIKETYKMFEKAKDTNAKVIIGISLSDYERDDIGERFDYGLVGALNGAEKSLKKNINVAIWYDRDAQDWEYHVFDVIWNPMRKIDVSLFSAADLHIYDSQGRHVGVNYETGEIENEIPGAYYSGPNAEPQKISISNLGDETYQIVLVGIDNGAYHLKIEGFISGFMSYSKIIEGAINIGEIQNYPITVPLRGPFRFLVSENFIDAVVDIDPDILELKSTGNFITGYIELPYGFNGADIDINLVKLNDLIYAEIIPTNISDYDNEGVPDLMVKFSRSAVAQILQPGDNVEIKVSGILVDGTEFEGVDYIKVI